MLARIRKIGINKGITYRQEAVVENVQASAVPLFEEAKDKVGDLLGGCVPGTGLRVALSVSATTFRLVGD